MPGKANQLQAFVQSVEAGPVSRPVQACILTQFSHNSRRILTQFSHNSRRIRTELSHNFHTILKDSHTVLPQFSQNSHRILTRFLYNSHRILTEFSHNSYTILTEFSHYHSHTCSTPTHSLTLPLACTTLKNNLFAPLSVCNGRRSYFYTTYGTTESFLARTIQRECALRNAKSPSLRQKSAW